MCMYMFIPTLLSIPPASLITQPSNTYTMEASPHDQSPPAAVPPVAQSNRQRNKKSSETRMRRRRAPKGLPFWAKCSNERPSTADFASRPYPFVHFYCVMQGMCMCVSRF